MQFGLDTKHWEIPFVYFVTIVIHLAGGENYMVLWCHVIHDYCIAKYKRFFIDLINVRHLWWTRWSSQIVSITLGTFVCCGKWTLLLSFTMCLNWVHVFFLAFQCAFCETCFTCISIFNSIGLQNTWNWIAHLVTWKPYASIHFYHSQQKRKERER